MPCYNNIIKNTRDTKHYEQMIPNQMINKLKDCEVDFMKAVIAIDSFKGSLSSFEAGNSAAEGIPMRRLKSVRSQTAARERLKH